MEERKLPVGIQSFQKLREDGYLYVDKTEYIWNLVNTGKSYFLIRPRRFGKSLLTSTIAAYFEGKKELFEDLAIEKYEAKKGKDAWQSYPVIYFSLTDGNYQSDEGIQNQYGNILHEAAVRYDVEAEIDNEHLALSFGNLIEALYRKTGQQVVVLVDDYDRPVLDVMEINSEQAKRNKKFFTSFFSVLKDEDQYVEFSFITGITGFRNDFIYGGLNQLEDISLTDDYACICGITEKEMLDNFGPEIKRLAEKKKISETECQKKLAEMYDGYHFSAESEGAYNPFSLINALKQRKFGSYWFETGTPTFLIHKLERSAFTTEQFSDGVRATEESLMNYRPDNPDPIPLFYQSGYLTISGWYEDYDVYELKFPNREVEYGFMNWLMIDVAPKDENTDGFFVMDYVEDLKKGDIDSFINRMKALFASIPYTEKKSYESEWRNEIFLVLKLLGQNVKSEVHTAKGRADCIVENKKYVYIFEFKLDQSADIALKQIDEKGYADPYKGEVRTVYEIGVNFSSEERNINDWQVRKLSKNR